ncbi:hypothetical protein [Myceligenerans pegani]|uniref:Uncharacterized protein n=1 Tax=Myceligenerans pegani TaxID=2776917 RepID=A0ABR9MTY8_9MICO|nr:hypothetical protein [Myceligenerans sp. TRM 65318]MBE1874834.1 hypothetical protein [Myceligenerans sp. TRM 65318]MBE3017105.1 hypothetical protein [Myceligenerans sp. TRM 65318]
MNRTIPAAGRVALTPRQAAFLDLVATGGYLGAATWIVAARHQKGGAVLAGELAPLNGPRVGGLMSLSYPVTVRPMAEAGLIALGDLEPLEGWTPKGPSGSAHYHDRGRPVRLTDAGRHVLITHKSTPNKTARKSGARR